MSAIKTSIQIIIAQISNNDSPFRIIFAMERGYRIFPVDEFQVRLNKNRNDKYHRLTSGNSLINIFWIFYKNI